MDSHAASWIDVAYLEDLSGGDAGFIKELLNAYLEATPPLVSNLLDATSKGDFEKARYQAHTLKGSSRSIGANPAADLAAESEVAAREADLDRLRSSVQDLQRVFDATLQAARQLSS